MKKRSVLVPLLLGLLAIFSLSRPGPAATLSPPSAELFDRLEKEGWQPVVPGVVQRTLENHSVETLGFGADGLRFRLAEMKAHLAFLRKELALHPSPELRRAIRAHQAEILRVQKVLRKVEAGGGLEAVNEALVATGANCSANYDAIATLPIGQGVSANASASFTNGCGYIGEVYAHSYVRATSPANVVVTMTKSDPAPNTNRSGANATASSLSAVNGVKDCYAYAYSTVTSYDLEITYAQSATSSTCPDQTPYHGAPLAVPGTIKAADFDNGGEGIAYHDSTPGNIWSSTYRTSDVDMYDDTLWRMETGEWLEYTIDVTTAGTYSLIVQVTSEGAGGSMHVELDGVNVTGPLAVPDTGNGGHWGSIVKTGVLFPAGRHVLRVVVDQSFYGSFYSLRAVVARAPFGGTVRTLPGTISAADFDEGGELISYHDNTAGCYGICDHRTAADVDLWEQTVIRTSPGEWMEYSVNVTAAGIYTLSVQAGNEEGGGTFHVEFDGVNVTGPLTFPATGSWGVFQAVTKTGVSLSAGHKLMRIVVDSDGGHFDPGSFYTITVQP